VSSPYNASTVRLVPVSALEPYRVRWRELAIMGWSRRSNARILADRSVRKDVGYTIMQPRLEPDQIAKFRVEIFPPNQVYESRYTGTGIDVMTGTTQTRLMPHAYPVLAMHLQKAGMQLSPTMLFLLILYRAGDELNYPIVNKHLADDIGVDSSNMSRSIAPLVEMGAMEPMEPPTVPAHYKFPRFEILLERVRNWKASRPPKKAARKYQEGDSEEG